MMDPRFTRWSYLAERRSEECGDPRIRWRQGGWTPPEPSNPLDGTTYTCGFEYLKIDEYNTLFFSVYTLFPVPCPQEIFEKISLRVELANTLTGDKTYTDYPFQGPYRPQSAKASVIANIGEDYGFIPYTCRYAILFDGQVVEDYQDACGSTPIPEPADTLAYLRASTISCDMATANVPAGKDRCFIEVDMVTEEDFYKVGSSHGSALLHIREMGRGGAESYLTQTAYHTNVPGVPYSGFYYVVDVTSGTEVEYTLYHRPRNLQPGISELPGLIADGTLTRIHGPFKMCNTASPPPPKTDFEILQGGSYSFTEERHYTENHDNVTVVAFHVDDIPLADEFRLAGQILYRIYWIDNHSSSGTMDVYAEPNAQEGSRIEKALVRDSSDGYGELEYYYQYTYQVFWKNPAGGEMELTQVYNLIL